MMQMQLLSPLCELDQQNLIESIATIEWPMEKKAMWGAGDSRRPFGLSPGSGCICRYPRSWKSPGCRSVPHACSPGVPRPHTGGRGSRDRASPLGPCQLCPCERPHAPAPQDHACWQQGSSEARPPSVARTQPPSRPPNRSDNSVMGRGKSGINYQPCNWLLTSNPWASQKKNKLRGIRQTIVICFSWPSLPLIHNFLYLKTESARWDEKIGWWLRWAQVKAQQINTTLSSTAVPRSSFPPALYNFHQLCQPPKINRQSKSMPG